LRFNLSKWTKSLNVNYFLSKKSTIFLTWSNYWKDRSSSSSN